MYNTLGSICSTPRTRHDTTCLEGGDQKFKAIFSYITRKRREGDRGDMEREREGDGGVEGDGKGRGRKGREEGGKKGDREYCYLSYFWTPNSLQV